MAQSQQLPTGSNTDSPLTVFAAPRPTSDPISQLIKDWHAAIGAQKTLQVVSQTTSSAHARRLNATNLTPADMTRQRSAVEGSCSLPRGRKSAAPVAKPRARGDWDEWADVCTFLTTDPEPEPESESEISDELDVATSRKFTDDDEVDETAEKQQSKQGAADLKGVKAEVQSHISIDSDSDSEVDDPDATPWRLFPWSRKQRATIETFFCLVHDAPVQGTWNNTEVLQCAKDAQMLHYMQDYPLKDWVIGQEQATLAYHRMLERTKWRTMGVRIYGPQRLPELIPGSTTAAPEPSQINGRSQPHHAAHMPAHYQMQGPMPLHPQAMPVPLQHFVPSQLQSHPMLVSQGPPPQPMPPHRMPYPQHIHASQPPPMPYPIHITQMLPSHALSPTALLNPTASPKQPAGKGKRRADLTPPRPLTPPPAPKTPPYTVNAKPAEPRKINKSGKENKRKQAEADQFPWHREGVNFKKEKAGAVWDDSIYSVESIRRMDETRARNHPKIEQLDKEQAEQQRKHIAAKREAKRVAALTGDDTLLRKRQSTAGDDDDEAPAEKAERGNRKKKLGDKEETSRSDPYHSGNFQFVGEEDRDRAKVLGHDSPDVLLADAEQGSVAWDALDSIFICWNPGKKGLTQDLEQATFSVRDTLVTRKQLSERPILTRQAGERLIDFCPDQLWRGMLLRVASEAGMGNKDIRDRFCRNGCWCDKATMTKRISAALGQKQTQPKAKGYVDGEEDWYHENTRYFDDYISFFGKRQSHRNQLKPIPASKRARSADGERSSSTTAKRVKIESSSLKSSDAARNSDPASTSQAEGAEKDDGGERDDANGDSGGADAVSVQSSDIFSDSD